MMARPVKITRSFYLTVCGEQGYIEDAKNIYKLKSLTLCSINRNEGRSHGGKDVECKVLGKLEDSLAYIVDGTHLNKSYYKTYEGGEWRKH